MFLKLAKGETAGDIAEALSLSVKTVSTYRTRLMEKMNLASNSDLTYYALKNKLIDRGVSMCGRAMRLQGHAASSKGGQRLRTGMVRTPFW